MEDALKFYECLFRAGSWVVKFSLSVIFNLKFIQRQDYKVTKIQSFNYGTRKLIQRERREGSDVTVPPSPNVNFPSLFLCSLWPTFWSSRNIFSSRPCTRGIFFRLGSTFLAESAAAGTSSEVYLTPNQMFSHS